MMNGYGWGMGWFWIIGIGLVIFVIWIAVRGINRNGNQIQERKSPLDILKERYARGEIDKQQFEDMKKDLI